MTSATAARCWVLSTLVATAALAAAPARIAANEIFIEAEQFTSAGGWKVQLGPEAEEASGLAVLNGAGGAKDGVATATVHVQDAGPYHIWVRYNSYPKWRGPFHVTALAAGRELGDGLFDAAFEGHSSRDIQTWRSFEVTLPQGEVTLKLSKHENANASGPARRVDCLLLTTDEKLVPNHLHYGAQTYARVTLGEGYEKSVYLHVLALHFHVPYLQHFALAREGAIARGAPGKKECLLTSGERTPWCNITPMIQQDSGGMLCFTARHTYTEHAPRLCATFELATAPDDRSVVRTVKVDNRPAAVAFFIPPNLLTAENRGLLKTDREIAEATGQLADAYPWPTHGKPLDRFPFFVTTKLSSRDLWMDSAVESRETKTLGYFGFTPKTLRTIRAGAWFMNDESYCRPDVEKMKKSLATAAAEFRAAGGDVRKIVYCRLMDEPGGQPLEFAARDAAYADHFRVWLKQLGRAPGDLLVNGWDAVKIVTAAQRDEFPALYYFSQRFRSRALGDFMALQGKLVQEAYGGTFPVQANFSDGAIAGNFYLQGVDYFELLDSADQNAIWSEDWSNGASTYQLAAFNVDLMRSAARERGQRVGNFLIAHAHRKAWDIKLKATSELARGTKALESYYYGPSWAAYDGGPYWRSHLWQAQPETWGAHASLIREIGAAEDLLLTAMPAPAQVALLYSSASDAWTINDNLAYGYDRMHTWLALAHAQMPVDVLSETQAERGLLDGYRACYLSGPNLARAAAEKLRSWVACGGTLWLTAGAASRDEFNRPLDLLDALLPADRGPVQGLEKIGTTAGRNLALLSAKDAVCWEGGQADVLAVKQPLVARPGAATLARFQDKSPAVLRGTAGRGTVYCVGFLPALAYIKQALDARSELQRKVAGGGPLSAAEQKEAALLERSANPWKYPADLRELILMPARTAGVAAPITCHVPLVDAVFMQHDRGVLIPLANYTLEPIADLALAVVVPRRVVRAESARHGSIGFRQSSPQTVELSLPLENNDFVKLLFE